MRLHLLAALVVPVVGSAAVGGLAANAPTPTDVAQATKTTDALIGGVVAAVAAISDATPAGSSAEDVAANSAAISTLLPCDDAFGLVDATGAPLDILNLPKGSFEANGLRELLGGAAIVQSVQGGHLRTMVPLTSDMHPNCVTCHTNYGVLPSGTVVGAATFKVEL